ncbi:internal Virion Protein (Cop-L3L) [Adoxophyes honmai entomopoxvirus 'L']|uniref:Internal Virion Protein (Cop-L3L) n=1 Tax=Adoxophyes honmai entomopoxvirus 'L' TaxID=1293540 RepID=A0A916KP35_9POXV|nr:internal Virion Protein (Cop-L3L) [Adoxophyes honmai entomopoxvirus 'L']CCU55387.1 internal Virion Protein (Cop-L3L) [Adoxophyes honmai entomopoxvirus 'L']
MSDNTFINNNIFNKELITLNEYLKNAFVNKESDKQILNNINVDNFNEKRLKTHFLYSSVILVNNPLICIKNFKYSKEYTIEDISSFACWENLSKMVEKREAIGFPLIYKYILNNKNNKNIYDVLFESNITYTKFNAVYDYTFSSMARLDSIKFQKLLISYTLYKNNILYYGKLDYDVYNIPKTNIMFKVQDLYFIFELVILVVLSPSSKIFYLNGFNSKSENVYINDVLEDFRECTDKNFIEYFMACLNKYIDYNNIPSIPPLIIKDIEHISEKPIRGSLVKIRAINDKFHYGILVDYFDDNYKVCITSSSSPKNIFNHIVYLNRENIFKSEQIISITKGYYVIGKNEYCFM